MCKIVHILATFFLYGGCGNCYTFAPRNRKTIRIMQGFNKGFIYFICLVSAMGGLLFGYDWVVIGGAKPFYELYFGIADSVSDQGLAMTIALIGCMIGACTCGWLADRRKAEE